jgi:hypothetical protein
MIQPEFQRMEAVKITILILINGELENENLTQVIFYK